jgi:hypothetical protein
MISGKYKIYDTNKVLFKNMKKVKIEISDKLILKKKENIKYFCKYRNGANYICDKCDNFYMNLVKRKKRHISHIKKLITIYEYPCYLKTI